MIQQYHPQPVPPRLHVPPLLLLLNWLRTKPTAGGKVHSHRWVASAARGYERSCCSLCDCRHSYCTRLGAVTIGEASAEAAQLAAAAVEHLCGNSICLQLYGARLSRASESPAQA
eukprot:TRINITY_DN5089_c1_g1_i1.p1 TRINITY_DN5089_c1_g1~~TRINITY_DN5089_c1_g1_i1.p1  ORF type:complete len:115 (-),score=21.09 TRINITY_DN5089_c1_g1_i1:81-425(-)